jgi:PAS domain S-box-containing protein
MDTSPGAITDELRPIFDLPIVGVVLWDETGAILDANDRFLEITGQERADLQAGRADWRSMTPIEWHATDDRAIARLQAHGSIVPPVEKEYLHRDGHRVVVEMQSVAVGGSPSIFLSLVNDVTDRARAREEREAALDRERIARKEAEAALRSRDAILAIVSHDLRNPLSMIMMTAGLLEREADEGRRRTQVGLVRRAVADMRRLIQDLLDVNQIESGRLSIAPEPVDARALLDGVRPSLDLQASQNDQALEWPSPPRPLMVMADRVRIGQVLANIVGNAIKFTPPLGRIVVDLREDGGAARFCVADTGPGIDRADLPRVFDGFWQSRHRARRGGVGLGLAIAHGIVKAHGGRIWVASESGEGARFCFTIPLDPAQRANSALG